MSSQQIPCKSCGSFQETVFCRMSSEGRNILSSKKVRLSLKKGSYLYFKGDRPQGIYCVLQGLVKLECVSKSGGVRILKVLNSGDLLGVDSYFSESDYLSNALASEDTELCFIPKEVLLELLDGEPKMVIELLGQISRDAKNNARRVVSATELNAHSRIVDALLQLKHSNESKKWSRYDIAAWAGTTPESVGRSLALLEKDGLIGLRGHSIDLLKEEDLRKSINL